MFKNVKFTTKIIGVIAIVITGMLTTSTSSYIGFNKIGAKIEEISEYQVPLNKIIVELQKDILKEEILTYELIIASKDAHSKKFKDLEHKIEQLEQETSKKIKECEILAKKAMIHSVEDKIKTKYRSFLQTCSRLEHMQKEFEVRLKQFENNLEAGHSKILNMKRDTAQRASCNGWKYL